MALARAAVLQQQRDPSEHIYPNTGHAFFNDTRPIYSVSAARDAFARTLEFFRRALD